MKTVDGVWFMVDVTPENAAPGADPERLARIVTAMVKEGFVEEVRVRRASLVVVWRLPEGENLDPGAFAHRLRMKAREAWNAVCGRTPAA